MTLPRRVTQMGTARFPRLDDTCMECGGPSVVSHVENDGDVYYNIEGSPFCSIDCVERWHGIIIENN